MSLRTRTVASAKATLTGEALSTAVRIASIPILARLLTPDDYGLVAIATSLAAFLNVLMDGGLSTATLQRPQLTETERSSLHWINVSFGVFSLLALSLLAPALSAVYDRPELIAILPCFGFIGLIRSLNVQRTALLQREMSFGKIARASVIGQVSGTGIGLVCAASGLGFWSLVAMEATTAAVRTLVIRFSLSWRPTWTYQHSAARPLLRFGLPIMGANLINKATSGLDMLMIGYFHSSAEVGLFNRAIRIIRLPLDQSLGPIMSVLRPALFSKANTNIKGFDENAYKLMRILLLTGAAIAVASLAFAEQAVLVILGPKWSAVTPIFIALAPFVFTIPSLNLLNQIIVSKGSSTPILKWRIFSTAVTVAVLLYSVRWGALGVAIGMAASGLLVRIPLFVLYTAKVVQLDARVLFSGLLPGVLATSIAVAVATYFYHFGYTSSLTNVIWTGPAVLLSGFATFLVFPQGRLALRETVPLVRSLGRRR